MSKPAKDFTGLRYGRLTILRPAPDWGDKRWWCRCDCGTEFVTDAYSVAAGRTISCGCARRERARQLCSTTIRKCTPVVVCKDGNETAYPSANCAAQSVGLSVMTILSHLKSGRPTRDGIIIKPSK